MSKSGFQFAGWIAAVSAALTVPLFAFQAVAARAGPTPLSAAIQMVIVLLFLYLLSSLRALLTQKRFEQANRYLAAIIGVTLCVQVMALFTASLPFLALPVLAGLVVLGILYIVAGIKLLAYSPPPPGLRLFSYAAIVVGACSASIVLVLFVLPASMVMDIALAIVFFREAGNPAADAANGPTGNQSE
jgi:hypothetical protein